MSTSRPRQQADSGVYHVMNRGRGRQTVFASDIDRFEFVRLLAWIRSELGVVTLAYCLMGNHYHLLLWAEDQATLSKAMQYLSSVFTQHTNRRLGSDGAIFRGRFHSIPVETDGYLLRASRYIHLNALDLPGVTDPRDHRWSSYPALLGDVPCPDFLDTEPVMSLLGHDRGLLVAVTEAAHEHQVRQLIPFAEIEAIVSWAIAAEDLASPHAVHEQGLARTISTLVCARTQSLMLRRTVADHLWAGSPTAARTATATATRRLEQDPSLQRMLDRVEAELSWTVPFIAPRTLSA